MFLELVLGMQERQGLPELIFVKNCKEIHSLKKAFLYTTEILWYKIHLDLQFNKAKALMLSLSNISCFGADLVVKWKCCKGINRIAFTENFFLCFFANDIKRSQGGQGVHICFKYSYLKVNIKNV